MNFPSARTWTSITIDSVGRIYVFSGLSTASYQVLALERIPLFSLILCHDLQLADLWRIETRIGPTRLWWSWIAGPSVVSVCCGVNGETACACCETLLVRFVINSTGPRGVPSSAYYPSPRRLPKIAVDNRDDILLLGTANFTAYLTVVLVQEATGLLALDI
jgi:hypothetical protein